jgi:ABC-type dipeptide/oligopeptide/nickel transport system permease subunit
MIGTPEIFGFLGVLCGLVGGLWWGFSHNWIIGLSASAGGAVGGGIIGYVAGLMSEEIPIWIDRISKTRRALGTILLWLFCLLYLSCIGLFGYAGLVFIRHMREG